MEDERVPDRRSANLGWPFPAAEARLFDSGLPQVLNGAVFFGVPGRYVTLQTQTHSARIEVSHALEVGVYTRYGPSGL